MNEPCVYGAGWFWFCDVPPNSLELAESRLRRRKVGRKPRRNQHTNSLGVKRVLEKNTRSVRHGRADGAQHSQNGGKRARKPRTYRPSWTRHSIPRAAAPRRAAAAAVTAGCRFALKT